MQSHIARRKELALQGVELCIGTSFELELVLLLNLHLNMCVKESNV